MHKLTSSYKTDKKKYDEFALKAEALVKELVAQKGIVCHYINCRVKSVERLEEKIIRKDDKYDSLDDITDLVGIRVITYFEDDVDVIAGIIAGEFKVDNDNSVDKRKHDSDRFGYNSLHYVVELSAERQALTEYLKFKGIKVEIQIRSVLQHAWAEIEHDIGYKNETSIPDFVKRSFYRVAALLETADLEFVNIKTQLQAYTENIGSKIDENVEPVEINAVSLKYFMENSRLVSDIDTAIFTLSTLTTNGKLYDTENLVEKLVFLKIKTIAELEKTLTSYSSIIPYFAKNWVSERINYTLPVPNGISIFYLCYVLVGQKEDEAFEKDYVLHFRLVRNMGGIALLDTYKKTMLELSTIAPIE